jgi:3-oxoacyl-[acyl-carrier-protein] synthase II
LELKSVIKNRVVVTGLGAVSSVGIAKDAFWESIINGRSGISKITSFDTTPFRCHMGGEVRNFIPENFIHKRKVRFLGKVSQYAVAAASLALTDASLSLENMPRQKFGVMMGTTNGERPFEELTAAWARSGLKEIDRQRLMQAAVNNISANVALYAKAEGQNYLFPTACAAGNYAIGYGFDLIRDGVLNFVLAGGADAFSYLSFTGFNQVRAMSPDLCRPFDKNRKGMMLGEGSGVLLLENLHSALKRKANIYAEIIGYGLSCDAYHVTAQHPEGVAMVMEKALRESGLTYKDVDYISAHGTGTMMNDKVECQAIKEVFKERSKNVAVSSIKSMLGHAMGAASALEAIACCLAVKNDVMPPTANYETPDPECDIDCVPNQARKAQVNIALNNSFAFGGNNACVVFKKFTP